MDTEQDVVLINRKRKSRSADASALGLSATPVSKRTTRDVRILNQPGFVLHSYPYKETSLIVEVFSREYGRLSLVAKGAKRPTSALRSVLQTFQPLNVSWTGKSDIRTLTAAEWVGGMLPLEKSALLCGFYLNELLMKFLVRDEVSTALFDAYVSTLNQLAHNEVASIVLRKFELILLQQAGLIGELSYCVSTRARTLSHEYYVLEPGVGVRLAAKIEHWPIVAGKTLLEMSDGDYSDPQTQLQSKHLMRSLLAFHLNGSTLHTRQILIDLHKL